MSEELRFGFGKNWEAFLKKYSEERLEIARNNLLRSLRLQNLNEMTFLDIGSGSGLHSLSAWRSGAKKVVSFDYDPNSVQATKSLWELAGKPENWVVQQGSVLDTEFMGSLGSFDIVYSWGVLHHTGNMWEAIRNARIPLSDNGVFFIALYSDTTYRDGSIHGQPTPEEWLKIKQRYNKSSPEQKRHMEYAFVWKSYFAHAFPHPVRLLRSGRDLWRTMRQYKHSRGMEFWTDIRDWLGGWPMEFIKEEECKLFCLRELGLETLELNTGAGNTEFLFRPTGAQNYWDAIIQQRTISPLTGPFIHVKGQMWRATLPKQPDVAPAVFTLLENGIPLGYRNAAAQGICFFGEGRYRQENGNLFFAASDNSNPNTNSKTYSYFWENRL